MKVNPGEIDGTLRPFFGVNLHPPKNYYCYSLNITSTEYKCEYLFKKENRYSHPFAERRVS